MTPITIEQALQIALGHHQAGRLAEAETFYREVLAQRPDHADALHLMGALACQAGRVDAAIDLIRQAIAIDPLAAHYHHNLGEAYRRSGQWDAAIARFLDALTLRPDHAETVNSMGAALYEAGRTDEAIKAYRWVLDHAPDHAWAHTNLGNALRAKGRLDEAIAAYRRAVALKPDFAEAYNSLGVVLQTIGQTDEALAACRRAIECAPEYAEAHNSLGNVFRDQGRLDLALEAFARAVAVKAGFWEAASNRLVILHFRPESDAQTLLAEHRRWAGQYAAPLAAEIRYHANDRTPDRRLRVGFLSPDFRNHPVGQLLGPLFTHHDRRASAFFAYSDVRTADRLTEKLRHLAHHWCDCVGLSDAHLADRIRIDRIDVLVDLAQHTAGNRLLVFARKPAPVQVSMLGMPTTTGLGTIDYRLTDPYLDPPGLGDGDYTEQSIRLPHGFWCYEPAEGAPPVGALPARSRGHVTFGCLNQLAKLSGPALELWATILRAASHTRLVLHAAPGGQRDAVLARLGEDGVAPHRVEFAASVTHAQYLARYHDLDLCLDPFPYNGGTTTMDALWMGVPVVTLAGRTAVGRSGVSILSNLGLPELIARTPEQYVAIALGLAADRERLAQLRNGLRERMMSSPLMDGKQYAADVEAAFRRMWRTWCGS